MGWLSSFFSGVSSFVSSVASSIGSALSSAVSNVLSVAGGYLNTVGTIVSIVATVLGLKKEFESVEEIGAKAIISDKKPENFDSYNEYINYLRNEIKLDKERFEKATDIEKTARLAIGTTILTKGIEEQKGFNIPFETWVAMAKLNMTKNVNEINTILDTFKDGNLENFSRFVDGKLGVKAEQIIGDTLVDMYKKLEPNSSIEDIERKVMKMGVGH